VTGRGVQRRDEDQVEDVADPRYLALLGCFLDDDLVPSCKIDLQEPRVVMYHNPIRD
jgi:hypothetical protein